MTFEKIIGPKSDLSDLIYYYSTYILVTFLQENTLFHHTCTVKKPAECFLSS